MSLHDLPNGAIAPDFEGFIKEAQGVFGERIYTDYLRRFAHGIDASCYRYVPRAVVRAKDESDIIALFALSDKYHTPLTFRAAGTSLSGQACSDSILVLANAHWQDITLHFDSPDSPQSISCSCGVIGQEANDTLKPYGKKIGPDPATINNAMIGGIFSNNSSGMCCGVKQNSYNTIKSVRLILGDGSIVDTSARAKPEENLESFLTKHANIANALLNLREQILADEWLQKLIARKFAIKNTTGYSINALLDFDNVREILNHIFIGAEGTLGFVSKVEYECVEDYAFKACALLFYENLIAGAKAVQILAANESLVSAAEIMDYACLVSAKDIEGAPRELQSLQNGACAILVQLESNAKDALDSKIRTITSALKPAPSLFGVHFSQDSKEMASWWKIRKALLPLAAANRPSGSIVITEDICFPIESFAQGIAGIEGLFARFKFEGIIFGHALSGNVHFIITPNLNDKAQSARFTDFMEALVDCVVDLGGSSKAEHGTGRMIAPFVEREWGAKAYAINRRIKEIFDPKGLINPDVIISDNPHIHTQNLKESAEVEDFINQCMECGFCEKVCPSRELTLTPRQRIAVRREIARLEGLESTLTLSAQEREELAFLRKGYTYFGVQTCATCSMCALSCPLEIDTAKIANTLSPTMQGKMAQYIAQKSAAHFSTALNGAKMGLTLANAGFRILGSSRTNATAKALGLPFLPTALPQANGYRLESKRVDSGKEKDAPIQSIIYFSACLNRVFAPHKNAPDSRPLQAVFESVCQKAGINVIYPKHLQNLCCGKAYRDFPQDSQAKANETLNALRASLQETLSELEDTPQNIAIVCDHSACSYELLRRLKEDKKDSKADSSLPLFDMPQFIESVLLKRLTITPLDEDIALYAMCATRKGGWEKSLESVARACVSGKVLIHHKTQCCGFAGNKGFSHPELNKSALRELGEFYHAEQEKQESCKNAKNKSQRDNAQNLKFGFSSSSTCEIGLNEHTNIKWQNLLYLVDKVAK